MNQPDPQLEAWLYSTPPALSQEGWEAKREQVEAYITALIEHNFARLVELLYRLDISENKLKTVLANRTETNSAALITNLIIERQLQKLAVRQAQQPDTDIPEDERW